jgi:hypothetical protein
MSCFFLSYPTIQHVSPVATWDATMRTIIKDERYKALNSITERKAAFREYIEEVKMKERVRFLLPLKLGSVKP